MHFDKFKNNGFRDQLTYIIENCALVPTANLFLTEISMLRSIFYIFELIAG